MTTNPQPQPHTSQDRLIEYGNFRYGLVSLTEDDQTALTAAFAALGGRRWYTKALHAAYTAAYESGRLTGENDVAGADDDHRRLDGIAAVGGGGAMGVAVAILVADLITAEQYRHLTSWWAKAESAWIPDLTDPPTPAPAPAPAVLQQDVPRRRPPHQVRPQPSGRPLIDHLDPPAILRGKTDARRGAPRQPGRPVDQDAMRRRIAADKKHLRRTRQRAIARATALGWTLAFFAVAALGLAADALTNRVFTPVGLWLGRGYGALAYLIVAIALVALAARSFYRAAGHSGGHV